LLRWLYFHKYIIIIVLFIKQKGIKALRHFYFLYGIHQVKKHIFAGCGNLCWESIGLPIQGLWGWFGPVTDLCRDFATSRKAVVCLCMPMCARLCFALRSAVSWLTWCDWAKETYSRTVKIDFLNAHTFKMYCYVW